MTGEIMAALGVTQYKTNPVQRSILSPQMEALTKKYGSRGAGEIEEWEIGPYCNDTSCHVPYGVSAGNDNSAVNVFVAFHKGLITGIDVTFSETYWDEMLPILDQKYGADWRVEHEDMSIINYETKESHVVQRIVLQHVTNGTNPRTKDRCQIWAAQLNRGYQRQWKSSRFRFDRSEACK
jgi:hypothetical protein